MAGFKLVDYSQGNYEEPQEVLISDEEDLRRTLKQFRQKDPRLVDLISPAGNCLTIGVGAPLGCVMFTKASGDPPYLWAVGDSSDQETYIGFDAGGTLTPVPLYRCLPFERVVEIAVYYFLNGVLPENVKWDED
jgi:hypothetical protein